MLETDVADQGAADDSVSGGTVQLLSGGTSLSSGTVQLPSVGTSLSSALPSPAWSRRSRRQRASMVNTIISPFDSTVSPDHVTRSDSTVSLDHITKKPALIMYPLMRFLLTFVLEEV